MAGPAGVVESAIMSWLDEFSADVNQITPGLPTMCPMTFKAGLLISGGQAPNQDAGCNPPAL